MTVTEKYLQIVLKYYIAQYPNQEYERKLIKGLWGYVMPCPFCSQMQHVIIWVLLLFLNYPIQQHSKNVCDP